MITTVLLLLTRGISRADLVAHWRFDEGSGTTAYDSSGNANNGTLEGDVQWVQGVLGGAIKGNGTNAFVRVPHSPSLNISDAITVALWLSGGVPPGEPISKGGWQEAYAISLDGRQGRARKLNWRGRPPGPNGLVSGTELPEDEWVHVAVTFDVDAPGNNQRIYINGDLDAASRSDNPLSTNTIDVRLGAEGHSDSNRYYFSGMLDDIRIYNTALPAGEMPMIMYDRSPELAYSPNPSDNENDVPRDMILSWIPGKFAFEHNVYFGTSWSDVSDASVDNPLGVLVSQGQDAATYAPDLLGFGQTYYWRVDEVNVAPDNTIFKGDVWNFTTEPFAHAVPNVTVTTNGISDDGAGPENIVNGSGLNADDQHSVESRNMWVATSIPDEPLTVQFEFDRLYKLHEMLVWNYNVQFELMLGFGVKDVTVEYSENGTDWMVLGDVELAQATARADYVANTTVDLAGTIAQYIRITINSGYGLTAQYGLSEVRFLYVPTCPTDPEPTDGTLTDGANVQLTWRAGREAASHQVHLGTDPDDLGLVDTTSETTYAANGLNYGTTYYWAITEVNEAEAVPSYAGEIWSFTTPEFGVVDDFDQYDDNCNRIFFAWEDGLGHDGGEEIEDCDMPSSHGNGSGSIVGHAQVPFAELAIVHSGRKSMPLVYDNASGPSEATLSLAGQDWTAGGAQTLSLFFYGQSGNSGQLYVKINNTKVAYDGQAADITRAQWHPWNIDLNAVGCNLQSVTSLTIGVDGDNAAGLLYIDDIRLYPPPGEFITPKEPGTTNLVALYAFEGDYTDSVGGHNATGMGAPQIINDQARGQVLSLDGGGDALKVAYSAALNPTEFTASLWARPKADSSDMVRPLIWSRDWDRRTGYSVEATTDGLWRFTAMQGTIWQGDVTIGLGPAVVADEWTHVGVTYANEEKKLYINGRVVAEGRAPLKLNTTQQLGIGCDPEGYYFFTGLIDEVRIYNQALSPEELAWLADRRTPMHKPF